MARMRTKSRLNVLMSAYACEPKKGSEPGVGWHTALEVAKYHDVLVITRANNRSIIEACVEPNSVSGLQFVYFDLPRWAMWWKRGSRGVTVYYYLWQIGAYFVARRLLTTIRIDVIHHVTFVKYWTPSFLSLLPKPFVWGPVGGGESAPRALHRSLSTYGKLYEFARSTARRIGELDPFVRLTARRSALAIGTTGSTAARLEALGAKDVHVLVAAGLNQSTFELIDATAVRLDDASLNTEPLRLISIGRLLEWKGFGLGLEAFAQASLNDAEYLIVGDGPARAQLEELSKTLGLADQVRFCGSLSRDDTLKQLGRSHVLVHPSLHDSGGFVCIEAMAAGRPVICLKLGGPAEIVDEGQLPGSAPVPSIIGTRGVLDWRSSIVVRTRECAVIRQDSSLQLTRHHIPGRGGGTGRRAGLKILWARARAGSTPAPGTKQVRKRRPARLRSPPRAWEAAARPRAAPPRAHRQSFPRTQS